MQTTLTLWLVVERNNKYVRGKKRAVKSIERMLSSVYGMNRLRDTEYEVTVEHDADDLEDEVAHMLQEINSIAEAYNCFLPDCDVQDGVTGRSW